MRILKIAPNIKIMAPNLSGSIEASSLQINRLMAGLFRTMVQERSAGCLYYLYTSYPKTVCNVKVDNGLLEIVLAPMPFCDF